MIREELIEHIKYSLEIGADVTLTEEDAEQIIKALEQQPCEECISRQALLEAFGLSEKSRKYGGDHSGYDTLMKYEIQDILEDLPPVRPQQKMGRWIESTGHDDRDHFYTCSECGRNINLICGAKLADYPYCHCGAKMVEPKESE
jgi:hypothetical protein